MKDFQENMQLIQSVNKDTAEMRAGLQQQWNSVPGYLFIPVQVADGTEGLFDLYMEYQPVLWADDLPCKTCRSFIISYGALGFINASGEFQSALWNEKCVDDPELKTLFRVMREYVEALFATGNYILYFPDQQVVGAEVRNSFNHYHLDWGKFTNGGTKAYSASDLRNSAMQRHATALNLVRGFSSKQVKDVLTYFKSDADLVTQRAHVNILEALAEIVIWDAFAFLPKDKLDLLAWQAAPYIRDDLSAATSGVLNVFFTESDMDNAKLLYLKRTDKEVYQRVQRDFTLRELQVAEKLLEESGLIKSIHRRPATLDDVAEKAIYWRGKTGTNTLKTLGGIPLKKDRPDPALSGRTITKHISLNNFIDEFLPSITEMKIWVGNIFPYLAFTVPTDPTAPNILMGDNDIASWTLVKQIPTDAIALSPNTYAEVEAVIHNGYLRYTNGELPEADKGYEGFFFALKGARFMFDSTPALFKAGLSRDKFDYAKLANVIDKYTTETRFPSTDNMLVVYPTYRDMFEAGPGATCVISGKIDGVEMKFSIKTWK